MVDCKINVEGRTYWGNVSMEQSATAQLLDKKIRQKEDVYANNDYRRLRIKIESEGGKWDPGHGIVYGLTKQGWVYQYMTNHKEGISQTTIVALDADPPFVAYLHLDLQGVAPEKRQALLAELEGLAKQVTGKKEPKPEGGQAKPVPQTPRARGREMITIMPGDWLSKIALARWNSTEWQHFLEPTEMTLASRKANNEEFDEDLIYPGDTFYVIPQTRH